MSDSTTTIATQSQPHQGHSHSQGKMREPSHLPQSHLQLSTEDQEQRTREALAAFTATLHSVGANLEIPLRERAATLQSNDVALERQEAELVNCTQKLAKQNAQWEGVAEETRRGLKEIGDVQNWAEMIERDLLVLEDMMECVERREGREREENETDSRQGNTDVNMDENTGINTEGNTKVKTKDATYKGWLRWW